MIGQQAIVDSYLCLLHLTAGILVGMSFNGNDPLKCWFLDLVMLPYAESLFNAFATAAFFKFVVFSIFEMRYLLAIWKATRPSNSGEGWETVRRELSFLYSRFCKSNDFLGVLFVHQGGSCLSLLSHMFVHRWNPSWRHIDNVRVPQLHAPNPPSHVLLLDSADHCKRCSWL